MKKEKILEKGCDKGYTFGKVGEQFFFLSHPKKMYFRVGDIE